MRRFERFVDGKPQPSWEPEPYELPLYIPEPRSDDRKAPFIDAPDSEASDRVIVIDLA
jgi:hypothetical protein